MTTILLVGAISVAVMAVLTACGFAETAAIYKKWSEEDRSNYMRFLEEFGDLTTARRVNAELARENEILTRVNQRMAKQLLDDSHAVRGLGETQ